MSLSIVQLYYCNYLYDTIYISNGLPYSFKCLLYIYNDNFIVTDSLFPLFVFYIFIFNIVQSPINRCIHFQSVPAIKITVDRSII